MRLALRGAVVLMVCALALALVPLNAKAAPPQDAPTTYVVQSGDTLSAIAIRYRTTVAEIQKLNKLGNSDLIQVGQKLLIPDVPADASAPLPVSSASYIIQPGDTLYRIALQYGTTMRALQQLNDIPNPNLVSVGQALAIPNSVALNKPGLIIDPPTARQGGTVLVEITRADVDSVSGTLSGKSIQFTRAGGYFYGLLGISRCAKLGTVPLALTVTDRAGQTAKESISITIAATAFPVDSITLPPAGVSILQDQTLINREASELATIVNRYTPTRLWSGVFRQPLTTPRITEIFGTRRSYNGGPVGACGHEGTDFGAPAGSPVYAPARGRVVFAGLTQVRGNMTVIDHGVGVFSAYYHQSAIDVQVGQVVEAGTPIGKVGSTGLSTGPHLHWSMWVNGEYVDPMEWTKRMIP